MWYNFDCKEYNVRVKARGEEMTAEELEKIVARHEMQCLELKESLLGIDPGELGAFKTSCLSAV